MKLFRFVAKKHKPYYPSLAQPVVIRDKKFKVARWKVVGRALNFNHVLYRLDGRTAVGVDIEENSPEYAGERKYI